MNTFGYYDPTSVQKAAGITADKAEAKYVAGGQSPAEFGRFVHAEVIRWAKVVKEANIQPQ